MFSVIAIMKCCSTIIYYYYFIETQVFLKGFILLELYSTES